MIKIKNRFLRGLLYTLEIVIKVGALCAIVFFSYTYLNKVFKSDVYHGESFHALPEDSIDVVVLGSSHAQFSFNPSFFYEDTGLYAYVLGTGCQPFEASYEMLKEALKTQKPKLVILEVYTAMPLKKVCETDSCYVTASYQMTGQERINTLNYLDKEKAREYYNDFINNHNNWKTIEDFSIFLPKNVLNVQYEVEDTFGYEFQYGVYEYPENWWVASSYEDVEEVELDDIDYQSLENMYALCQEKGIEMLLYKTPVDGITREDQSYLNAVWKWANEHNVNYIDYISIENEIQFYMWMHSDSFHCYVTGAEIITDHMADFVNDMGVSFQHKDSNFLKNKYISSEVVYSYYAVEPERNPKSYLTRLKNTDGYIFINYNPERHALSDKMYQRICNLGIDESLFDRTRPFYAIIKDNELLEYSYGKEISKQIEDKDILINYQGFSINGELYQKEECDLSLVYAVNGFSDCTLKNIDTTYDWEYGYEIYVYGQ